MHQGGAAILQPIALAENTIGRKPENGGNHDGFTENGPMYTLNATGVHGVAQPIPFDTTQITSKANYSKPQSGDPCHPLAAGAHPPAIAQAMAVAHAFKVRGGCEGGGKGYLGSDDVAFTISTTQDQQVAQPVYELHSQDNRVRELGDVCTTVSAAYGAGGGNVPITLMQAMAVRRLTPVECERLQGFPDKYTDIQPNGKATPDGPRYKALGNSMAVPVMGWIGKRIQEVDAILKNS